MNSTAVNLARRVFSEEVRAACLSKGNPLVDFLLLSHGPQDLREATGKRGNQRDNGPPQEPRGTAAVFPILSVSRRASEVP